MCFTLSPRKSSKHTKHEYYPSARHISSGALDRSVISGGSYWNPYTSQPPHLWLHHKRQRYKQQQEQRQQDMRQGYGYGYGYGRGYGNGSVNYASGSRNASVNDVDKYYGGHYGQILRPPTLPVFLDGGSGKGSGQREYTGNRQDRVRGDGLDGHYGNSGRHKQQYGHREGERF